MNISLPFSKEEIEAARRRNEVSEQEAEKQKREEFEAKLERRRLAMEAAMKEQEVQKPQEPAEELTEVVIVRSIVTVFVVRMNKEGNPAEYGVRTGGFGTYFRVLDYVAPLDAFHEAYNAFQEALRQMNLQILNGKRTATR